MNNNSLNDIIPPGGDVAPQKRSIRDIPLPEKRANKIDELLIETADFRAAQHPTAPKQPEPIVPPPSAYNRQPPAPLEEETLTPKTPLRRKSFKAPTSPRKFIWLIALIAVLVLVGGGLMIFRSAKINVTLKVENIAADVTVASSSVLPIQKEATKEVNASGTPTKVEKKATGTIIVYNNYSNQPQQLVATTRFETPDGLIYRIDKPITVPGTTVVNGKTVPGSVEAVVTADQSGDKYNIATADFTIPGFKGGPKYDGFYARSKTALSGGFSGTMAQVSDADLKAANAELQKSLTEQALADVDTQKAAGTLFFKDGIQTTYTSSITPGSNGKATVTGKLSLYALIFDQSAVENALADSVGKRYNYDNINNLVLTVKTATGSSTPSFVSTPIVPVELKGDLTSGNSFDVDALKRTLAGKSKNQLQEILKLYPEVTKADAVLHPFWSSSFPKNADKIKIEVTK